MYFGEISRYRNLTLEALCEKDASKAQRTARSHAGAARYQTRGCERPSAEVPCKAGYHRILDEVIEAEEAFSIKDLKVGGRDVIALGIEEGPAVGRILADVLDQVIDEKLVNERDRIIDYVQKVHL